ncbi:glycosyltransferase [Anthocerotibacter panamensis]|uniref:glycosyltransferase n=1 Tax=Anthocerotibacter panamensis TaxID=2857077 RepID=UPI001C408832|nr:glycosyltransferase [Anthocerotibacter panamensis]
MRVLFVNHTAQLGGAEHCLIDLAGILGEGCRVALLSDGPLRHRLESVGCAVQVLRGSQGLDRVRKQAGLGALGAAIPAVLTDVRAVAGASAAADLIWANTHKAFVVSALAGRLARKPVVYHLHDMLDRGHFSWGNRKGMVLLANTLAHRVVANSLATAQSFKALGGRPALVEILYNGFAFEAIVPLSRPRDQRFLVGLFSRLTHWKGQHVLLDALARLDARFHGLLVGDALFAEDHRYLEQLRQQVHDLGLTQRVHFLGYRADARALMATCDALVHCSVLPEAFGRVVVEGMATGRPVVAVGAGGVPEILEDGRTGLLVPPNDALALALALARLQADPQQAQALGEAGRQSVRQRFDLSQTQQALERILGTA